jgi:hypothetical protein
MTTILYHNNMLLADSRTNRKTDKGNGADEAFHCVHCGETAHSVCDTSGKIKVPFKKTLFREEVILAVAGAGQKTSIDRQLRALMTMDNYENAYEQASRLIHNIHTTGFFDCAIMVVTDKHVHVIDFRKSTARLHADRYTLTDTVTIGSGGVAAKTAIIAYKADVFEAMRVASEVDKSTGGPIRYVDFSSKDTKLEVLTYEPLEISVPEVKQEESPKVIKPRAARKSTVKQTLTTAVQDLKKVVK